MNIFRHADDEPAAPSHAPIEEPVNTLTVTCAQNGAFEDIEGYPAHCPTLADVEAWCADLRGHGATDGLLIDDASNCLSVTLTEAR